MQTIDFDEAVAVVTAVLTQKGYSSSSAKILSENCVSAQRDGSESHGVFRIKDYLATIASGYVNGNPTPRIEYLTPGLIRVDADNGFAQVALNFCQDDLQRNAETSGIAAVAIRNSHHLGALYLDVERFAENGFLALAVVNSIAVVAPPGGRSGVYGTNPIAFAAPRGNGPPLVFDLATSVMSHGDVQVAARKGIQLPPGTGINKQGSPTSDPSEILDGGALTTFGGYKGASIALMIEVLCAGLVGADFSFEVDWAKTPGARTARTRETVILIDPRVGRGDLPPLGERVDTLISALTEAGQTYIPGDRRIRCRANAAGGVVVTEEQWAAVLAELTGP